MKHAIMVIGHGNQYDVLQKTISHLDDSEIDFFILWDKKYNKPNLHSKYSKLFYAPQINIYWGTDSQVIAEKEIFKFCLKFHEDKKYEYAHLISSSDIPLMTKSYFKEFFTRDTYISFLEDVPEIIYERVKYYYPIRYLNVKSRLNFFIIQPIRMINKLLRINRTKNIRIEKGSNWFSIRTNLLREVVEFKNFGLFLNSFLADELYVQTILCRYKPNKPISYDKDQYRKESSRFILWEDEKPVIFKNRTDHINLLKSIINTNYAFARKVYDESLIDSIFL